MPCGFTRMGRRACAWNTSDQSVAIRLRRCSTSAGCIAGPFPCRLVTGRGSGKEPMRVSGSQKMCARSQKMLFKSCSSVLLL